MVIAYASIVGALADEQLEGRLHIEPALISTTSEVLTDETEERIEAAWGQPPVNAYAATEAPGIAIGSLDHIVREPEGLRVRIVPKVSAPPDLPDRVRFAVARELEEAGAAPAPILVEPVDEIERDPGHAAKVKLVTSAR